MTAAQNAARFAWYKAALEDIVSHGCALAEETGLVGKLGELHVAVEIGGTMATTVNQKGFDLLSSTGERVAVKTVTRQNGYSHFNARTFDQVDRVVLVYVSETDGIVSAKTVYDGTASHARSIAYNKAKGGFYIDPLRTTRKPKAEMAIDPITAPDH